MADGFTTYRVFISCPGDVSHLRDIVREFCDEISLAKKTQEVKLEPWDYVHDDPHEIDGKPVQPSIDRRVGDYDIYIGILWKRFGEPLDHLSHMTPTEYEFEEALKRKAITGRPIIKIIFYCEPSWPSGLDEADQLRSVFRFRNEIEKRDIGLYDKASSEKEFRKTIHAWLCKCVDEYDDLTQKLLYSKIHYETVDSYLKRSVYASEKHDNTKYFLLGLNENDIEDLAQVVTSHRRVILLGPAGSGKSTELHRVAAFYSAPDKHLCPALCSLKTYTGQAINDLVPPELDGIPDKNRLLILDGFDEIQDQHRGDAVCHIETYAKAHPDVTILVSSRSNFYVPGTEDTTGTLENFKPYNLMELDHTDVEEYLTKLCPDEDVDKLLYSTSGIALGDLLTTPFYLIRIGQIVAESGRMPNNRADLFHKLIELSVKIDEEKFRIKSIGDHRSHILTLLERLALNMELLGKNFVTAEEFTAFISSDTDRQLLNHVSIWTKGKNKDKDTWQFEHNNFQEYLAAKVLVDKPLDEIKSIIFFKPDFKRIIPSWFNTLCFLIDSNADVRDWLLDVNPEVLVNIEPTRLAFERRMAIFKAILEEHKAKKVWLSWEKYRRRTMARFVDDPTRPEAVEYLLGEIESNHHYSNTINAISILQYLTIPVALRERAVTLLEAHAITDSDATGVKAALIALTNLKLNDKPLVDRIVAKLRSSNKDWVRYGLYYFIHNSECLNDYVDVFLEGIKYVMIGRKPDSMSRLMNESTELNEGLDKVTSFEGICAIMDYFQQNEVHSSTTMKVVKHSLAERAARLYIDHPEIYQEVISFYMHLSDNYQTSETEAMSAFFRETETVAKAFMELKDAHLKRRGCIYALAYLANTETMGILVTWYQAQDFPQDGILLFRNLLRERDQEIFKRFDQLLSAGTDVLNNLPPVRDFDQERRDGVLASIELLFEKEAFVDEVRKVFEQAGTPAISFDDIFNLQYDSNRLIKTLPVIFDLLQDLSRKKPVSCDEVIQQIDAFDWERFAISYIYDYLSRDERVALTQSQKDIVAEWCYQTLENFDFTKCIKVKGKTVETSWDAVFLWYFYRKLDLKYPEDILLDMTTFDYWRHDEYSGLKYLEDAVSKTKLTDRILRNLAEGIEFDRVLKNHLEYCKQNKIAESLQYAEKIILDRSQDDGIRQDALELIQAFPDSKERLEKLLPTITDGFMWQLIELLWNQGSDICLRILENALRSSDEKSSDYASGYLVELNDLRALDYFVYRVLSKNRLPERPWRARERNPLIQLRDLRCLPKLAEILKASYEYEKEENSHFNPMFASVISAYEAIALSSDEAFDATIISLNKFVADNKNIENVNFLATHVERITDQYYINKTVHLSVAEALKVSGKLLSP